MDDPAEPRQCAAARVRVAAELAAGIQVALPVVTLVETVWVLRCTYGLRRRTALGHIEALKSPGFRIERRQLVQRALSLARQGKADFADYVIEVAGKGQGADRIVTFDGELLKHPDRFERP